MWFFSPVHGSRLLALEQRQGGGWNSINHLRGEVEGNCDHRAVCEVRGKLCLNSALGVGNNVWCHCCRYGKNHLPLGLWWEVRFVSQQAGLHQLASSGDFFIHSPVLWGVCVSNPFLLLRGQSFMFPDADRSALEQPELNAKVKECCCRNPCQTCQWFLCASGDMWLIKTLQLFLFF